jgi:hypothetical protein
LEYLLMALLTLLIALHLHGGGRAAAQWCTLLLVAPLMLSVATSSSWFRIEDDDWELGEDQNGWWTTEN